MARKKKKELNYWIEAAGIILAGCALYVFVCLICYHPDDPSFETVLTEPPEKIHNIGMLIGAYASSVLFQIFGLGAFAVPAAVLLFALKLCFRPSFNRLFFVRAGLYLLLFMCLETAMSLMFGRLDLERYRFDAGGAVTGGLIAYMLTRFIGGIGAWLVLLMTVLLLLMALTKVSYVTLWNGLMEKLAALLGPLGERLSRFKLRMPSRPKRTGAPPESVPAEEASGTQASEPADDGYFQPALIDEDIPIKVYRDGDETKDDQSDDEFTPVKGSRARDYRLPPLSLLDPLPESTLEFDRELLRKDADVVMQKLSDFGVKGKVVEISPGPVITRFEFEPASGVKLNRIVNLSDDLALAMKATSVRIAPIAGKSVVGIELPSKKRKVVSFREIAARQEFQDASSRLTFGLGKDIAGGTIINDLSRMPHLLVAGTTGSGKSVFINTVICSVLFKATPDEVRFLMVDPKRLELFPYDGIPHLLHPVVVDPKKAAAALRWAVEEMDRRYRMIADRGTRNIVQYNKSIEQDSEADAAGEDGPEKMPYIVVVIDELADLMLIAARDVEGYIARLAQMARAAGIHLLVATQRPSVDILTGVIKANFPSRISFQVSSKVDSRTILDTMGAEKLLGMGDMLFIPPGTSRLQRVHGAYISEKEINRVTEFIKKQGKPEYDASIVAVSEESEPESDDQEYDELYDKAVALVADTGQASISMLQRRLRVGYNRAARMIELMEKQGVVGPSDGVRPRDVLVNKL